VSQRGSDFDLKAFLRRWGLLIYTGDREGDFLLIEDEIRELRQLGLIDTEEYVEVISALAAEKKKLPEGPLQ